FSTPTFINLDPDWVPVSIPIRGMRIGINGKEATAGQAFANLDTTVNAGAYDPQFGQELSPIGTVIALEKSAETDEFFLTFELLGTQSHTYVDPQPAPPATPIDAPAPVVSDIGFRTFEEINATISELTGVPVTNASIASVYDSYIQQLPTVEAFDAFLPSHQMAIAQLALTSCSVMVDTNPGYFPGFNFADVETVAFDTPAKRNQIIDPLLTAVANYNGVQNLTSQPTESDLRDMFGSTAPVDLDTASLPGVTYNSLIDHLIANCTPSASTTCNASARTQQIVKAVCASAVGGAVTLVQ
ncbi:MAG: LamG domain-containing protein, partial [Pseudomonadota bacterium]